MAAVIFFEKPGCAGNARQKALLAASGHAVDARNLLTEPWTTARLRAFFGDRPVVQWFNAGAPRVKSGEISTAGLTAEEALTMMIADPLLIRRPLLEVDGRREAGFDAARIDAWIGLAPTDRPVDESCQRNVEGPARCQEVPR
jgi:nitrogenase-associated protein